MNIFSKLGKGFASKVKSVADATAQGWTSFNTILNGSSASGGSYLDANKEWVFIAVDKVAKSVSSVRFKVMKYNKEGDDTEIFDGEVVRFLEQPAPKFTGKQFIYLTTAYKELTGNAFWNIEDKKAFWPLIPTSVTPATTKAGIITGYKYQLGANAKEYTFEQVIHDRYVDPRNPYWGTGKLAKIASWVDTNTYANEFNRLFFLNGAQFGGFIETEEESKERISLIKLGIANDHAGVKNAHKIGVLPKGSKFAPATATMHDMQFTEMDDRNRDKILGAFGVPKTLVGFTTEVNRASAEAAEYVFAKYTVKPIVDEFVEFLNQYVVPIFDKTGQIYISYDNFIPENEELQIRENEAALARGPYKTINEVRAEHGLAPITGGDTIYGNPFANVPIGGVEKSANKPKRIRSRSTSTSKVADDIVEKAVDFVEKKNQIVTKSVDDSNKELDKDALTHKEFVSRVTEYQKQMAQKLKDYNARQRKEVLDKLTRIAKGVTKADIFDYEVEVDLMVDLVSPLLKGLLTEQAIKEFEENEFPGAFNPTDANITAIVDKSVNLMAKSYNDSTLNLLKVAINDGIKNGLSITEIASSVSQVYEFSDTYRALQVAHTETFFMANEGSKLAYEQSGVVKTIRWYTSQDNRVCEFCGPLHGDIIDVDADFFKKGDVVRGADGGTLNVSYRNIGVPPLHPNCNCFIRPEEIRVGA